RVSRAQGERALLLFICRSVPGEADAAAGPSSHAARPDGRLTALLVSVARADGEHSAANVTDGNGVVAESQGRVESRTRVIPRDGPRDVGVGEGVVSLAVQRAQ